MYAEQRFTNEVAHISERLIRVGPEMLLPEALEVMCCNNVHHLLVMAGERLLGLVSDRDIIWSGMDSYRELMVGGKVQHVMRIDLPTIAADQPLVDAVRAMQERNLSAVPIVDEDGQICGVLTESDLVRHALLWLGRRSEPDELGVKGRAQLAVSNPLVQDVMKLLGDIGI